MTPEQGQVIIAELGSNYGCKLMDFAKKNKFKKERGGGYYKDPQIFRNVIKGHYESQRIEKFILKAYIFYKEENEKHAKSLEALVA